MRFSLNCNIWLPKSAKNKIKWKEIYYSYVKM